MSAQLRIATGAAGRESTATDVATPTVDARQPAPGLALAAHEAVGVATDASRSAGDIAAHAAGEVTALTAAAVIAAAAAADLVNIGTSHAPALDGAVRIEWAAFLADPVLPRFSLGLGAEAVVSFSRPAEQGLWRDITLARRVETALRQSAARYEAIFHSAPMAMVVASLVDGHPGRFLLVNPALSSLTGYPPSDLLDLGFADLDHPTQGTEADRECVRRADGEEPSEWLRRWVHADGHDHWVRIRMAPVHAAGYLAEEVVCHIEATTRPLGAAVAVAPGS
jgi:PAS domain S-box-containing protein